MTEHRCFWVHCVYGCFTSCDHTELCYASQTSVLPPAVPTTTDPEGA